MTSTGELPTLPQSPGPHGSAPPAYADFRQECPVAHVRFPSGDSGWLVTTHADVTAVYTDRRFGRTRPADAARLYPGLDLTDNPDSLINLEGARHTRLRRLAGSPFLPRRAEAWRPVSQQVTTLLLDEIAAQGPPADLVRDFAYPYPLKVICRLLGVPEADAPDFRRWAALTMSVSAALTEEKAAGMAEFTRYLSVLIAARRKELRVGEAPAGTADGGRPPAAGSGSSASAAAEASAEAPNAARDSPATAAAEQPAALPGAVRDGAPIGAGSEGGFLDDLIFAADADGDALAEHELVSIVRTLIIAGHETTAGTVVRGVLALIRNPDQAERLRAEPDRIAQAVEEIVRLETPGQGALLRYAEQDTELPSGAVIPAGHAVFAPPAAANRDPDRFPDPLRLDLGRDLERNLGGHLAFGLGAHYCLGASLARIELQVAFAEILRRFPGLRLAVGLDELSWSQNSRVRVPTALPITW